MDKLIVYGGSELNGEISISGSKNAVLPIMAATIIEPGIYTLKNVPNLRDTQTMMKLMEMIGANVIFSNNSLQINTENCNSPLASYEVVKTMRASFYVLGPFMARFNKAEVSLPGGCAWGPRPINFHLEALESLGADVNLVNGMIVASGKLKGTTINFATSSVGATGNVIMAAVKAEGTTIINNAAREPEIEDLCRFLIKMGADIEGVGSSSIKVNGVDKLNSNIVHEIIPDRIEAGTYLIAAAISRGHLILNNVNASHLGSVITSLELSGMDIDVFKNKIIIKPRLNEIMPVNIETEIYPGFPTDLQAQWMAYMTQANDSSEITENIYLDRFTHIGELTRLGAKINLVKNTANINGCSQLIGAPVMSTDIRASASLIIAAIVSQGKTEISRIYHIDRGYEQIEKKLTSIGLDIKRLSE